MGQSHKPRMAGGHRADGARQTPLRDRARFLRSLIANPRHTGAVAPSGRALAEAMAAAIGAPRDGLVVELGPGTGPVTQALLASGVKPENLLLIEFDSDFCKLLSGRFPRVRVVRGDAYGLRKTLGAREIAPIRAFVSSLPLLSQPRARRIGLFDEAMSLLAPDGAFVQFTYGLFSPVPPQAWRGRGTAQAGERIWSNLPPARVWTYRPAQGARP